MEASKSRFFSGQRQTFAVAPQVWGLKTLFVNLYFIAEPDGSWVLVDAGVPGCAHKIKSAAEEIFGEGARPKAILLTHGHFDHIGAVKDLADEWEVPVYAHPLELPYLTGQSSYPPPDSSVGGGGMAYMAFAYPKKPINIRNHVELLPTDGSVPGLTGWQWIHTPGHTPGHVSLFREEDRLLVVGDAFTTRHAESAIAVMTEKREVHGPPAYFTPDWAAAHRSVDTLADLNPAIAASGHGMPMKGEELHRGLENLVKNFWVIAVPTNGRYVHEPAVADESGVISVPPPVGSSVPKLMAIAGVLTLAGFAYSAITRRNKQNTYTSKHHPLPHNRVASGLPPTVDPDYDDPTAHTNNYP